MRVRPAPCAYASLDVSLDHLLDPHDPLPPRAPACTAQQPTWGFGVGQVVGSAKWTLTPHAVLSQLTQVSVLLSR